MHLYLEALLTNVDVEAYYSIYEIVKKHPEYATKINFSEINFIIKANVDEEKALKFKEKLSENDLDQRNDFLDLYISLLPDNSKYLYEAYILKAQAELFRYRICFDKSLRENIKIGKGLSEEDLNNAFKYDPNTLSELNLIYAVQKYNEATRYAQSLENVNFIDAEIKKILQIAQYE